MQPIFQQPAQSRLSGHPLWLLLVFWACVVIAIAAVLRRLNALIRPTYGGPPEISAMDASFSSHALVTAMHIIPAAIFVILAAGILPRRNSGVWLERLFFPFGAITGATAYAMIPYAIGSWIDALRSLSLTLGFYFPWAVLIGFAFTATPHVHGSG